MHISTVSYIGYRSLQNVDVTLVKYNTLIGKNDSGKSSFLNALRILFDPELTLQEEDVCRIAGHLQDVCMIEATIEECAHPLATHGKLKIRKSRASGLEYLGEVPKLEILKNLSIGKITKTELKAGDGLVTEVKEFLLKTVERISPAGAFKPGDLRAIYNELENAGYVEFETGWCPLDKDALSSIVKVVILFADARAEEELIDSKKTVLQQVGGMILREATSLHVGLNNALRSLNEEIQGVTKRDARNKWVLDDLNDFESTLAKEINRFDASVLAEPTIVPPRTASIEFSLQVNVSDGMVEGIEKMGHGLRRSVVFAMLRTHRLMRDKKAAVAGDSKPGAPLYLFLIEEPELYLHPQAERRRMRELKELSQDENTQVVVCTHSAIFVDLADYRGIHRFDRPDRGATIVKGWTGKDLAADPQKSVSLNGRFNFRARMMFADLVILVEGQCEETAIPFLADRLGLTPSGVEVEVVDCNSNSNIPPFQEILETFGIKYVAWFDSDDASHVKNGQKIAKGGFGKVITSEVNWERMNGLPTSKSANKVYNSWKHFVLDGIPPNQKLTDRITAAYEWREYL